MSQTFPHDHNKTMYSTLQSINITIFYSYRTRLSAEDNLDYEYNKSTPHRFIYINNDSHNAYTTLKDPYILTIQHIQLVLTAYHENNQNLVDMLNDIPYPERSLPERRRINMLHLMLDNQDHPVVIQRMLQLNIHQYPELSRTSDSDMDYIGNHIKTL